MNDPHVEALHFEVRHSERVTYDKAAALDHEEEGFIVHIESGRAVFVMKTHHATPESAREAVEPFIRAWEL